MSARPDLMSEANKEFASYPLMVFLGIGMFFALLGVARFAGVECDPTID